MNFLTVFGPRIAALIVAAIVTWLTAHYGVNVDQETQHQLTETIVLLITEFVAIYSGVHRGVSKKVNPGDAAGAHLADAEKTQSEQLKAQD